MSSAAFTWLAISTAWFDWTTPPDRDGTPVMSLLFFFLLPVGILMLVLAIRDFSKLRRKEGRDTLRWATFGLEALGALTVTAHVTGHLL